jgi:membrane protein
METRVKPCRWRVLWKVLRRTASSWHRRNATTQAAAISFFTLFSLAPILILATAVAGSVLGEDTVRAEVIHEFQELMGKRAASVIQTVAESGFDEEAGAFERILGVTAFLIGATAVFSQIQRSLNRMWDVEPRRGRPVRRLILKRLLSFTLVVGIGFLLLVSLALSAAVSGLQDYLELRFQIAAVALDAVNAAVSIAVFTMLFAAMFRLLPDVAVAWNDVWLGAFATALLITAGKWAIGAYVGQAGLASTYGAASSIVVILLWVYLASLLVLFGAVFTRVWGLRGSDEGPAEPPAAETPR